MTDEQFVGIFIFDLLCVSIVIFVLSVLIYICITMHM